MENLQVLVMDGNYLDCSMFNDDWPEIFSERCIQDRQKDPATIKRKFRSNTNKNTKNINKIKNKRKGNK